jgi:glycosyltransferase involved in cell wall biosynthesis
MTLTINNLQGREGEDQAALLQASSHKCKTLHMAAGRPERRPHVLFVIDALLAMGGTERVLQNMIRLLPKERFRCSLVTFRIDETAVSLSDFDCPVYVFPLKKTYDWNALKVARLLRNLSRQENVDVVHTFFETSDLWAGLIARFSGHPVLISSRRDLGIARSRKHVLGYKLVRDMHDVVLAVSPQVRDYCIAHDRVKPAKIRTLFNGVDFDAVSNGACRDDERRKLGVRPDQPVIITVANIRRVKGLDVLVEAAREVCLRHQDALFLVMGKDLEPDYSRQLQSRIAELQLGKNFKLLGARAEVFAMLSMSDIFCLPSRSEGFSNALIEAMAAGLPCVATDVGGNREVLEDGKSGFMVASEDTQALAKRLIALLDDPAVARFMGQRGRAVAESKFTVQGMMKELVAVYGEQLAARGWTPCSAQS